MSDVCVEALGRLQALAPGGAPFVIREPLATDESEWFLRTLDAQLFPFRECPEDCFRYKKFGMAGPDHFSTPAGKPRHLFSKPGLDVAWLNREYVPHIAAYGFAVLARAYDPSRSSFSLYRAFSRDLIAKRKGQSFETDAEFYDFAKGIHLQVEAKASGKQTTTLADAIVAHGQLADLPDAAAKEIEYVLDLQPRFLWIVGPGSLDPPRHVFEVSVSGLNAKFRPLGDLPLLNA